ncbi:hypothetical protein TeGR_g538, partial [Tetraparma gracilis]
MHEVDDWVQENCDEFEGVKADDEQQLSWSDLHGKFVEMVENRLESFCKEKDVPSEEVFESLQEINDNKNIAEDFVPAVIKMCEYQYFLQNMIEAADARSHRHRANSMSGEGLSGCYVFCPDMTGKDVISEYYKKTMCPWYFRKILTTAMNKLSDVVIHHEVGQEITFKYSLPLFGRVSKTHIIDGVSRESTNMWGKTITARCMQEDNGDVVVEAFK